MEHIISFINAMQQVRFYASVVEVRDNLGKIHRYTKDAFWGIVIPAWIKKEQA